MVVDSTLGSKMEEEKQTDGNVIYVARGFENKKNLSPGISFYLFVFF